MRHHVNRIGGMVVVAFLVITFLVLPTSAGQLHTPRSSLPAAGPPAPTYLVTLPVIPPDPAELPADMSPDEAAEYARSLTYRQAGPILAQLRQLQSQGKIAAFEVRPDLHAILVQGAVPEARQFLSRLPNVTAVLSLEEGLPACAVAAAQSFPEQLLGLSRLSSLRSTARTTPQATDPSIYAYVQPASAGSGWSYVWGYTTENTPVTMRILRGGQVIATQTTTSYGYGSYYLYPSWQSCPTYGYSWDLRPGDVVEVSAHGSTVSTVVAHLRAWVDPAEDTVAGRTDPGRLVQVELLAYGNDPCAGVTWYEQVVGTDGSGNFSADFTDQVDFDRKARAEVSAYDANLNSTFYYYFYAYRIYTYFEDKSLRGYLKPEVNLVATLSRSGNVISTYSGRSDPEGYFSASFTATIRAGDVILVSGGGASIQYTAAGLDVSMNPQNDQAAGTTGAGRVVQANFYKRSWGYLMTTCSWVSQCQSTIADGNGDFTLAAGLDLVRGDYAYFYVYDGEGNYQYGQRSVPALAAYLSSEVAGYWGDPNTDSITVTLRDSGGTVKERRTGVYVSSWDGGFSTWMSNPILPTDRVEATDGEVTKTMTVQSLTARLDGDTGHLTGSAPEGHLVAELQDFRRDQPYSDWDCVESDVPGGAYDLAFAYAQPGGQDLSDLWCSGPDGHYTGYPYAYAFTVNAQEGDDVVHGYSETPYSPITITLERGGVDIAVAMVVSEYYGYYYSELSDGTPVSITPGDILRVQTGDGDNVSLPIPELTANAAPVENQIYGKSPANEPIRAEVRRIYNWGAYSYSQNSAADASGDYSVSFVGLHWSRDCSAVSVGHRCAQRAAYYYNDAGHLVWVESPYPPPIGADLYESDDISATASVYTGIQSHSFHAVTDTDWVAFTVPQADVDAGVPYRIETFNLGWGMDTYLHLYDTDGVTELAYDDDSGNGLASLIVWTPTQAGTYYAKARPFSSHSTAYCDASYDLMVLPVRGDIYLPVVLRNR